MYLNEGDEYLPDNCNDTLLYYVKEHQIEYIQKMFSNPLYQGINVNQKSEREKDTLAHECFYKTHSNEETILQIFECLCDNGLSLESLNATNARKSKPLHFAAFHGYSKVVQFLIQKGVDIDCVNINLDTPLHLAVSQNHFDAAKVLLQEKANVFLVDNQFKTALSWAIQKNNLPLAQELLDSGANINHIQKEWENFLFNTDTLKNLNVIEFLVKKGINIFHQDFYNNTILHFCAKHDNSIMWEYFLNLDVNPLELNNRGKSAFDILKDQANETQFLTLYEKIQLEKQLSKQTSSPLKVKI